MIDYGATKITIISFTKCLATRLIPKGTRVHRMA